MRFFFIYIVVLAVFVSCRGENVVNNSDDAYLKLQELFASIDNNTRLEICTKRGETSAVGLAEIEKLADFFRDARLHEVQVPIREHREFTGELFFLDTTFPNGNSMSLRDMDNIVMSGYGCFQLSSKQAREFKKLIRSIIVGAGLKP